jgi:hypothetical protein
MQSPFKTPFGCFLCIAAISLSASATVTVKGDPTISIEPTGVIAVDQVVTISYVDTVTLSPADTSSYSVTWDCYVDSTLNSNFPKAYGPTTVNSTVTTYPAGSGSFTFSESAAGTYEVYCTASGEATPSGGSAQSISGTTNTVTFTVASCTGSVAVTDDEQTSSDAAYIAMDYNLTPTMNPPYSGNQSVTIGIYQGITGDLTAAGLDIDCEGGNNDDIPEQYPIITQTGETSGSNSVTFSWQITQYGYSWDDCTSCDAPPGAVENVHFQTTSPGTAIYQKAFSCGEQ